MVWIIHAAFPKSQSNNLHVTKGGEGLSFTEGVQTKAKQSHIENPLFGILTPNKKHNLMA